MKNDRDDNGTGGTTVRARQEREEAPLDRTRHMALMYFSSCELAPNLSSTRSHFAQLGIWSQGSEAEQGSRTRRERHGGFVSYA